MVLWNANPLSIYAKAEKTMIEGVVYYDIENDLQHRASIAKERNELIGQLLQEKNKGMITQEPKREKEYTVIQWSINTDHYSKCFSKKFRILNKKNKNE
jgi:hypothetical protein